VKILCVHGWAFSPEMWGPLNQRLREMLSPADPDAGGLSIVSADLGFFGSTDIPSGHYDLAIGHSFGLLWLLDTNRVSCDRLVSINGFTRFAAEADFQCGWPHRILRRMRKGLANDAAQVIGEFLSNSATDKWAKTVNSKLPLIDIERLDWALEALRNMDGREQWSQFAGPRLVIAATRDQIVTAEQTGQCFPSSDIQWLKSDCHCLPLKFPEICAALIRELIEVS